MKSNHINLILRDPEEYPSELKRLLDIITIKEVPKVVGSYAYKNHKYPSDVDVFDRVTLDLPRKEAGVYYTNQFKLIFQKLLMMATDVYINDFKAGTSGDKPLRWTARQVLQGVHPSGVYLITALTQEAVVKLDVIAYISGKFQSVEVFYNLRYTSDDGIEYDFYPLGSYVKSLLDDVDKYASKEYYAPLKLAKRLWSLSRITDCSELFAALDPLMRSNVASLNQIKSDLEVLNDILADIENVRLESKPLNYQAELTRAVRYSQNIDRIHLEILQIYKRLGNHLGYAVIRDLYDSFELIFNEWVYYSIHSVLNIKLIDSIIQKIIGILKVQIDAESKEYLQTVIDMNIACKVNYNKYLNV